MAREIDLDDMSDDDVLYISQRSWLVDEALRVHEIDLRPRINKLLYGQASIPAGPGKVWVTESASSSPDDVEEIEEYEAWNKENLVKEIQARNADLPEGSKMSITGTKAQLIAALRADDEAAATAG